MTHDERESILPPRRVRGGRREVCRESGRGINKLARGFGARAHRSQSVARKRRGAVRPTADGSAPRSSIHYQTTAAEGREDLSYSKLGLILRAHRARGSRHRGASVKWGIGRGTQSGSLNAV